MTDNPLKTKTITLRAANSPPVIGKTLDRDIHAS
jgi:hypothetical protein